MFDYLLKRLLILVPTFIGISILVWLVMTLAPGDPGAKSAGGGLDSGPPEDLTNLEQGRSKRAVREKFGLNRPRFWNDWDELPKEEVKSALAAVLGGVPEAGAERYKEASRDLDDWGTYSLRPLVALLPELRDEPRLQSMALRYLRQNAYRVRALYPPGYVPTAEERARDQEVDRQNLLIRSDDMTWAIEASPEERDPVVAKWQAWWKEREADHTYSGFGQVWNRLTDTQFAKYWSNLARGDMGRSIRTNERVSDMILSRLKYSLSLAVPSFLIAWILAILLGVFSATHHRSVADQGLGVVLFALYSIPSFVMGTVLQRWLAMQLDIFPQSGFQSDSVIGMTTPERLKDILWHITLPMICYTYTGLASLSRFARAGMLDVLQMDYIRTARAKGLKNRTVVWRHAFRNGAMSLVTLLGTALPILLAGSVIIEYIFNIDGFGNLMITSIRQNDYNVVMGIQLIVAMLTLIGLLLTDLIYAAMDPRISFK
ncbi:MAG: ABC transporter permease [Planctomycetota bacterium]